MDRPGVGVDTVDDASEQTDQQEERSIVLRARDGDDAAFATLVDRYAARIHTHLLRLVRSREEAEDLTQETFLRAYRFLGRFDTGRPFRNWLYTIATNLGISALRSQRRRGYRLSLDADDTPDAAEPVDDTQDARRLAAQSELQEQIARAVDRLPPRVGMLVHLHYREGMPLREAGEIVGMTEAAAKVALHRARKTLRQWLTEEDL